MRSPGSHPRQWIRPYALVAGSLILGWSLVAFLVVPGLIRRAYRGEAGSWLNALITGQADHPVETYLTIWRRLATVSVVALAVGAAIIFLTVRFRPWLAAVARQTVARLPTVPVLTALALAAWYGLAVGLLEYFVLTVKFGIDGIFSRWSNPESFWMIPLATAALFVLASLVLIVPLVAVRVPEISLQVLSILLLTLGLYGVLRAASLGLFPIAAAALALGLSVRISASVTKARRFLRLARRTAVPILLAFGLLGAGRLGVRAALESARLARLPQTTTDAPNVLLLILDTVRAQNVSVHGYARPTTPNLERLAEKGMVFDRALATAPWTLPSHGTIFTGRYHSEMTTDFEQPLDATYPTLAGILDASGYATGGFTANFAYTSERSGLNRGFLHYEVVKPSIAAAVRSSWIVNTIATKLRPFLGLGGDPVRKYAPQVNADFLAWVKGIDDRPWFAFLNYFDAHVPYVRDEDFVQAFAAITPRDSVLVAPGRYIPIDALQSNIDSYDSAIASIDREIGRLLARLEEADILENTIVVVTSDHGEHLGEYGLQQHANSLYMSLLHVPLIIVPPGGLPEPVRSTLGVSIRDIPATILDLVGSPVGLPGTSLAGHWRAGTTANPNPSALLSEVNPNPYDDDQSVDIAMRALLEQDLHYIVDAEGTEFLFNIAQDPWEETNLLAGDTADHPMIQHLRGALDAVVAHPFQPEPRR